MKPVRNFVRHFDTLPYRCVIVAYEEGGKLSLVKHVWNHAPVADHLARSAEWLSWTDECYSALDAQYGAGAVERAEFHTTILKDNEGLSAFEKTVFDAVTRYGLKAPTIPGEIGRCAFKHDGKTYACAMSLKVERDVVEEIDFAWDRVPPPSAYLEGEREWIDFCLSLIEATFGEGSVSRIKRTNATFTIPHPSAAPNAQYRAWLALGFLKGKKLPTA